MFHSQVNALIKVVWKIITGDTLKVKNHKEINALWELAASHLSPVCIFYSWTFFVLIINCSLRNMTFLWNLKARSTNLSSGIATCGKQSLVLFKIQNLHQQWNGMPPSWRNLMVMSGRSLFMNHILPNACGRLRYIYNPSFFPLILTNSWNEVQVTKPWGEAPQYHTLLQQNMVFFFWNNSGVPNPWPSSSNYPKMFTMERVLALLKLLVGFLL